MEKLSGALATAAAVFCTWVGMNEPAVAELLAREGLDAAALDMQCGARRSTRPIGAAASSPNSRLKP